MIVSSGGVRDNTFYIDNQVWSNNRFSGERVETFYGSTVWNEGLTGLRGLILKKNREANTPKIEAAIKAQIQPQVEQYLQNLIRNPGYRRTTE